MTTKKRRSSCPINLSLEIFGDKWSLLILRDIIFFEKGHFNQFLLQEKISTNILTDRLNRLVENNILSKTKEKRNLSSYVYSLTEKGIELVPIIIEIYYWGAKNTAKNSAESKFLKEIETDKMKTINRIVTKIKNVQKN